MDSIAAYLFDNVRVDLRDRSVTVAGKDRRVGPKVFDMLLLLLRHRDQVLSRSQLLQAGWPGAADVGDVVLARTISRCRKAIDDDLRDAPRIRARWGIGYLFHGDLVEVVDTPQRTPPVYCPACAGSLRDPDDRAGPVVLAVLPVTAVHGDGTRDTDSAGEAECAGPPWWRQSLPDLLAQTLQRDPRINLVPADVTRPAPRDATPSTGDVGALRVWLHHGTALVLALVADRFEAQDRLQACLMAPDGSRLSLPPVLDCEPARLVQALAQQIERALFSGHPMTVPLDLPDSFAVQVYLRAADALRQHQWQQARRLAEVLLDLAPGSFGASLLRLQAQARCAPGDALLLGQRLLRQAHQRAAAETVATIHITLAQLLRHHADPALRATAPDHLKAAEALARDQVPSDWVIRVHLACAQACETGEDHHRAVELYRRAQALAMAADNPLRAVAARCNLAYIRYCEAQVDDAVAQQQPLVRETRALQLPAYTVSCQGMLAEMHGALGAVPEAVDEIGQALVMLDELPDDDQAAAASYLAHVAAALATDHGLSSELPQLLSRAGQGLHRLRPRHRAYLLLARARWSYCSEGWPAAQALLAEAEHDCRRHGLMQMAHLPLSIGLNLAMAIDDADGVVRRIDDLASLPRARACSTVDAWVGRGHAWLEHRRGDAARARRLLSPLAHSALTGRVHALLRLDCAWLAAEEGATTEAEQLLRASQHWPAHTTLGAMVAARVATAGGRLAEAARLAGQGSERWPGPLPAEWQQLAVGHGSSSGARTAAGHRATRLPGDVLMAALCGWLAQAQTKARSGDDIPAAACRC